MKLKASIIIPYIRPENIKNLLILTKKTAGIPDSEYEILLEEDTERIGAPKMVAKLVAKSKADRVLFLGDDCIPQKNFLKTALSEMDKLPGKWGLVGLNDLQRASDNAPTHWLGHKKMLKHCKEFFHTGYIHQYCDNELYLWATLLKQYRWAKDAMILHNHIGFKNHGKKFLKNIQECKDEDMKKVYSSEVEQHDKKLFNSRVYNIIKQADPKNAKEIYEKIQNNNRKQ